jgi:predicted RNase H-like nuclease (RuvC/YqgF family)
VTAASAPRRPPAPFAGWTLALVAAALATCSGCEPGASSGLTRDRPNDAPPPPEDPRNVEIDRLQARLNEARGRIDELALRNRRLEGEIRRLELTRDQLTRQLEVVGDAPRQRDRYKLLAKKRRIENERLKDRIERLEKLLNMTTAPATRPAEEGDTAP